MPIDQIPHHQKCFDKVFWWNCWCCGVWYLRLKIKGHGWLIKSHIIKNTLKRYFCEVIKFHNINNVTKVLLWLIWWCGIWSNNHVPLLLGYSIKFNINDVTKTLLLAVSTMWNSIKRLCLFAIELQHQISQRQWCDQNIFCEVFWQCGIWSNNPSSQKCISQQLFLSDRHTLFNLSLAIQYNQKTQKGFRQNKIIKIFFLNLTASFFSMS